MALTECLLLLLGTLTALYLWMRRRYTFWERTNVAYIKPNCISGNLREMLLMKVNAAEKMAQLYNHKNAHDQPAIGIYVFNTPALLIRDLELIKLVLIGDFNKFSDRFTACDPHGDALGCNNLFFTKNPYWRELRTKLAPVFTSGKIKQMFPLVEEIGCQLDKYLCDLPMDPNTNSCINQVKDITSLYTTDVIASVAFGIQANSIQNPNCEFRTIGKKILNFSTYRAFEFAVIFFLPQLRKICKCKVFPKSAATFLRDSINFVIDERIKSNTLRNDLIDVLVTFKKTAEADRKNKHFASNNDVLVAQAAAFYIAGFETSSSLMSFGLYELSKNLQLQKRLREEIKDALKKGGGKIAYDALNEMVFLNMVVQEVLRLYPPLPFLDRVCTLAAGETEYSLKPIIDFGIPHSMPVYIPIYAIQRDPKYFPNPDEFDPERFSLANRANVQGYMPFGTGPHNCIGERFGIVQAKIGLINFLKNHCVTICEKTHTKMILDPKALVLQSKGGIYLKLVRDPLIG